MVWFTVVWVWTPLMPVSIRCSRPGGCWRGSYVANSVEARGRGSQNIVVGSGVGVAVGSGVGVAVGSGVGVAVGSGVGVAVGSGVGVAVGSGVSVAVGSGVGVAVGSGVGVAVGSGVGVVVGSGVGAGAGVGVAVAVSKADGVAGGLSTSGSSVHVTSKMQVQKRMAMRKVFMVLPLEAVGCQCALL